MNKPTENPQESRDPLIDALLSEHSRLGSHDDVGLLATVRARTIDVPVPFPEPRAHSFSRADCWKVAAMVAAVLALIGVLVSRIETPRLENDTLQLVMRPVSLSISADENESNEKTSLRVRPTKAAFAAPASLSPIDLPAKVAESLALTYSDNPLENAPANRYEFDRFASLLLPSTELLAHVSVAADRTIRAEDSPTVIYEGRVQLAHPDFRLSADRLEFSKRAAGEEDRFGTFVATGKAVRVEKRTPAGTLQVAEGLEVSYDADGGTLTLWGGPPRLQTGGSQVVPDSLGGAIVLRQDGFQVIEAAMQAAPIQR